MGYVVKGFKQKDTKVVSLCKNGGFSWRKRLSVVSMLLGIFFEELPAYLVCTLFGFIRIFVCRTQGAERVIIHAITYKYVESDNKIT